MDTTALEGFTRGKSALNFNYLMNLYEVNYTLFTNLIDNIEKHTTCLELDLTQKSIDL